MNIILATQNKNKLKEFNDINISMGNLLNLSIKNLDKDIGDIEEVGNTYLENALIKADKVFSFYKQPVVADDSGLELLDFDCIPGLFSARYAGENATDLDNRRKLSKLLINNSINFTPARYRCVLVYKEESKSYLYFEAFWEGNIVLTDERNEGFGYDPMFLPNKFNCPASELSVLDKSYNSHRALAMKKLIDYVRSTK